MKKFKTFHCGINPADENATIKTAVEWANEWIEENPDVECIEFRHSLDNAGRDVICIMYDASSRIVEMERYYDSLFLNTTYQCPECGYKKIYEGTVVLHDPTCPSCKKGKPS